MASIGMPVFHNSSIDCASFTCSGLVQSTARRKLGSKLGRDKHIKLRPMFNANPALELTTQKNAEYFQAMKEKEDAETQARLQKEIAGMTPEQRAARDSVQILVIVIETKYFHLSSLLINSKRVKSFYSYNLKR